MEQTDAGGVAGPVAPPEQALFEAPARTSRKPAAKTAKRAKQAAPKPTSTQPTPTATRPATAKADPVTGTKSAKPAPAKEPAGKQTPAKQAPRAEAAGDEAAHELASGEPVTEAASASAPTKARRGKAVSAASAPTKSTRAAATPAPAQAASAPAQAATPARAQASTPAPAQAATPAQAQAAASASTQAGKRAKNGPPKADQAPPADPPAAITDLDAPTPDPAQQVEPDQPEPVPVRAEQEADQHTSTQPAEPMPVRAKLEADQHTSTQPADPMPPVNEARQQTRTQPAEPAPTSDTAEDDNPLAALDWPTPTPSPSPSPSPSPTRVTPANPPHTAEPVTRLALAAVRELGPGARRWVEDARARYPTAPPDGIARLAVWELGRAGRRHAITAAAPRLVGAVTATGSLARVEAQLVLTVAAAYGFDPTHPARSDDLIAILKPPGFHRRAVRTSVARTARAAVGLASRIAGARLIPFGAAVVAAVQATRSSADVGGRARTFYSQLT